MGIIACSMWTGVMHRWRMTLRRAGLHLSMSFTKTYPASDTFVANTGDDVTRDKIALQRYVPDNENVACTKHAFSRCYYGLSRIYISNQGNRRDIFVKEKTNPKRRYQFAIILQR